MVMYCTVALILMDVIQDPAAIYCNCNNDHHTNSSTCQNERKQHEEGATTAGNPITSFAARTKQKEIVAWTLRK
jgi:hypothetical protein